MFKSKKSLIALALTVATAGSFGQVYVQGAFGPGNINVDWSGLGATSTKNSNTGNKFIAGYSLGNGWSVESNVINYGRATGSNATATGEYKASGYGIGGAYTNETDKWLFRAGLALNRNKMDVSATGTWVATTPSTTSNQANFDFGAGYKINDKFALMAGYDVSKGKAGTSTGSLSLWSFGIRAKF